MWRGSNPLRTRVVTKRRCSDLTRNPNGSRFEQANASSHSKDWLGLRIRQKLEFKKDYASSRTHIPNGITTSGRRITTDSLVTTKGKAL